MKGFNSNVVQDKADVKKQLATTPDILPIPKFFDESVKVEDYIAKQEEISIDGSFIIGHPTFAQVNVTPLETVYGEPVLKYVLPKDNIYYEYFTNDMFIADTSTGTLDTANETYTLLSGQKLDSEIIYKTDLAPKSVEVLDDFTNGYFSVGDFKLNSSGLARLGTLAPYAWLPLNGNYANVSDNTISTYIRSLGSEIYTGGHHFDQSFEFNGETSIYFLAGYEYGDYVHAGGFSVWINIPDLTTMAPIVSGMFGNQDYKESIDVDTDGSVKLKLNYDGNVVIMSSSAGIITENEWHHIAFSVRSKFEPNPTTSDTILYVDNVKVIENYDYQYLLSGAQNNTRLGYTYTGGHSYFTGLMEDYRSYKNTSLGDGDVSRLYNGGYGITTDATVDDIDEYDGLYGGQVFSVSGDNGLTWRDFAALSGLKNFDNSNTDGVRYKMTTFDNIVIEKPIMIKVNE